MDDDSACGRAVPTLSKSRQRDVLEPHRPGRLLFLG